MMKTLINMPLLAIAAGVFGLPPTAGSARAQSAALYRCDENGGSTVFDYSGNDNHGSSNTVTYSSDTTFPHPNNFALVFDNGTDAVDVPAGLGATLHSFTALSLEARIKATATNGIHMILWLDDGPFILYIVDGALRFSVSGTSGSRTVTTPFTTTGSWRHVAGTYDGSTSILYLDGSPVASVPGSVGTITVQSRNLMRIGNDETADLAGFNRDFRGLIDDVRVTDFALSPEEVAFDATHSFTPGAGTAITMDCAAMSAGAGVSGGSLFSVGQTVAGRADDGVTAMVAGGVPCLAAAFATGGDIDGDGDVDGDDFIYFADCLFGPNTPPLPTPPTTGEECLAAFDSDADTDVDLFDFASFSAVFTGN